MLQMKKLTIEKNINKTPQIQTKFSDEETQILSSTTSVILKTEIKPFSNAPMLKKQEKTNYIGNDSLSFAITNRTVFSKPNMTFIWNDSTLSPREQSKFSNVEKQILNLTSDVQKINTKLFSNASIFQKQEKISNIENETSSTYIFIKTNSCKPNIISLMNNSILNPLEQSNYSKQEIEIVNLTTSAMIFEKLEKINNFANDTSSSTFVTPIISKPDSTSMSIGSNLEMGTTKTLLPSVSTNILKPSTLNPKFLFWNDSKKFFNHITNDESSEEYDYIQTRKNVKLTMISKLFKFSINIYAL